MQHGDPKVYCTTYLLLHWQRGHHRLHFTLCTHHIGKWVIGLQCVQCAPISALAKGIAMLCFMHCVPYVPSSVLAKRVLGYTSCVAHQYPRTIS